MKKLLIVLSILAVFACACACAAPFIYQAGTEDGFTLEAADTGDSPYWLIGLFVFFGVLCFFGVVIYKVQEVGL